MNADNLLPQTHFDVIIIGGGASGTMLCIHLLQSANRALSIAIIDPSPLLGDGIAYRTRNPAHILNVPAGQMSCFPDDPDDFVRFLRQRSPFRTESISVTRQRFISRMYFGEYLREQLASTQRRGPAYLIPVQATAMNLTCQTTCCVITLDNGHLLQSKRLIIAVGNFPKLTQQRQPTHPDEAIATQCFDLASRKPWPCDQSVGIIGAGLSMVDVVLELQQRGQRGTIHIFSSHGGMPLPHAEADQAHFPVAPLLSQSLRQQMRQLRHYAKQAQQAHQPWQSVMDRIRPHLRVMWQCLSEQDQSRFLRHVLPYWNRHRHRIAPHIYTLLCRLQASGQLVFHRCRVSAIVSTGQQTVSLLHKNAQGQEQCCCTVDQLITATGLELRAKSIINPLIEKLLQSGLARPGTHGLGLDTDLDGALRDHSGHANPNIYVLGSLRTGQLWESLAIPDLRNQAADLVKRINR